MSDRLLAVRRRRPLLTALSIVLLVAVAGGAAACTEKIEGGAACPVLCPSQSNDFRDTTIDAVVTDTTISGFPTLGLAKTLLVTHRPDTVETYGVIRFDVLPTAFNPNGGTDTASIAAIDSVFLRVVLDSTGGRGTSQVTLQAYDVDTTDANPADAVVQTLFRPDRLIGSALLTPGAARDTLRVGLSNAVVLSKITSGSRLHVGLRLVGTTSAQLRIIAFVAGAGAPLLTFDPSTDTVYAPRSIAAVTTITAGSNDELLARTVYPLTVRGTPDAGTQTLSVGGWPSRRAYLQFSVPSSIMDSSTVVRAELLLTQRKSPGVDLTDSIAVVPLVSTTTTIVTDLRRAIDLAAEGILGGLDSVRLVPGDSTERKLNVLSLVRTWSLLSPDVTRAIVLRSSDEGAEPAEARFYSMEAPAGLRPRLRITYLPRVDRAIP